MLVIGRLHSSGANRKRSSSSAILIMFCLNSEWIASVNQGWDFINEYTLVGKINYVNWLTYSDGLRLWPCRRMPEMVFELLIPLLITGEEVNNLFFLFQPLGCVCGSDETFILITWCRGLTVCTSILMNFSMHVILLSCMDTEGYKFESRNSKRAILSVQKIIMKFLVTI